MNCSMISLGLVTLIGSPAFAAGAKAPKTGYLQYDVAKKGSAVEVTLSVKGGYGGGFTSRFDRSKVAKVAGLNPRGEMDTMRYGSEGSTGNVGYHNNGLGAGFVTAVAAKDRGLVLMDIRAGRFIQGKTPAQRDLVSLDALRRSPAVKAAATRAGLDASTLSVQVADAKLSAGFRDKDLLTLAFHAQLSDAAGRKTTSQFSTTVTGNLAAGVDKLSLGSRIEEGLTSRSGWLYPPSLMK